MNEQGAIKRLKVKQSAFEYQSNIDKAFDMAIKALEKQIPKKVKKFPHFSIHTRPMIFYITHCPVCDHVVDEYEDDHIYLRTRNEYCNRCGQKLDWMVEE